MVNSAPILFQYQMDKQQRKCHLSSIYATQLYSWWDHLCCLEIFQLFYQNQISLVVSVWYQLGLGGRGDGGLGWPLANRRGGSWTRRHRELDRQLVLSPLPSSPRSRFWPEGRIVGHLGEMGLDKRLVLIPLVQGPAFDQLTTWRWKPFLLKIGLREQFEISARKRSLPSRGNSKRATREIDMGLDWQLVLSGLTSSNS